MVIYKSRAESHAALKVKFASTLTQVLTLFSQFENNQTVRRIGDTMFVFFCRLQTGTYITSTLIQLLCNYTYSGFYAWSG